MKSIVGWFAVMAMVFVTFTTAMQSCTQRTIDIAASTAEVNKEAYDVAMRTVASLYAQGLVGVDVKAKAIEYGRAYRAAHNAMVEALAQYVADTTVANRDAYLAAANASAKAFSTLLTFATPYIVALAKEK